MGSSAELERAILEQIDEPGAYQVYGDWLQSQGDPWGELITIQAALARGVEGDAAALRERERALLEAHGAEWLGGFKLDDKVSVEWFCGFVRTVRIESGIADLAATLTPLVRSRVGRYLRSLNLYPDPDPYAGEMGDLVATLDGLESVEGITSIAVAIDDSEWNAIMPYRSSWGGVRLDALLKKFGALRDLVIRDSVELDENHTLPNLRVLEIRSPFLEHSTMEQLSECVFPQLDRLILSTGYSLCQSPPEDEEDEYEDEDDDDDEDEDENGEDDEKNDKENDEEKERLSEEETERRERRHDDGADIRWSQFESILDGTVAPALTYLGVRNASELDDFVVLLCRSKIAAQLRGLDFTHGTLTTKGVAALVDARSGFRALTSLVVEGNALTKNDVKILKKAYAFANVEDQREGFRAAMLPRYYAIQE